MIKIVVLSMENAVQRRQHISERMKAFDLSFEFFTPPRVTTEEICDRLIYDSKQVERNLGFQMSTQEISCALGHVHIYRHYKDIVTGLIVLEDDAILLNGFKDFYLALAASDQKTELSSQFFLLGGQQFMPGERDAVFGLKKRLELGQFSVHRSVFSRFKVRRTVGYFIGCDCMKRACEALLPIQVRADDWWYLMQRGVILDPSMLSPIVVAHPALITGQSSINSADVKDRPEGYSLPGIRWRIALALRLIFSIFS